MMDEMFCNRFGRLQTAATHYRASTDIDLVVCCPQNDYIPLHIGDNLTTNELYDILSIRLTRY